MDTIKINIVEVSSRLAHEIVCAKFEDDDNAIYENTTDAITTYTEGAQRLFDEWYDYYYDLLFQEKI
jgi:hypothetical protein